ncbi:hypothetical protein D9M68_756950 [compost metagenome]
MVWWLGRGLLSAGSMLALSMPISSTPRSASRLTVSGAKAGRALSKRSCGMCSYTRTKTRGGSPLMACAKCSGFTSGPQPMAWITRQGPMKASRSTAPMAAPSGS